MFNQLQPIILSAVIILITFLLSEKIFKRGNKLSLTDEFKREWMKEENFQKSRENFIKFKEYQYNQSFWLVGFEVAFSMFIFGIILGFREFIVNVIGWVPYLTILICNFYIIYRFCKIVVPRAHNRAINNVKRLLQEEITD